MSVRTRDVRSYNNVPHLHHRTREESTTAATTATLASTSTSTYNNMPYHCAREEKETAKAIKGKDEDAGAPQRKGDSVQPV